MSEANVAVVVVDVEIAVVVVVVAVEHCFRVLCSPRSTFHTFSLRAVRWTFISEVSHPGCGDQRLPDREPHNPATPNDSTCARSHVTSLVSRGNEKHHLLTHNAHETRCQREEERGK